MIDEKTQSSNPHQFSNGLFPSADTRSSELLAGTASLPAGIREGNAGLLSLRDLEAQLGDGSAGFYGRLRRFADAPGIGELLGAVNVPGAKGVRYEPRSADIFRRMLAASTANEVTPATAVAWLKINKGTQPAEDGQMVKGDQRAIAEKTQTGNPAQTGNSPSDETQIGFATRLLSGILAPITAVLKDLSNTLKDLAGETQGMRADRKMLAGTPAPAPAMPDRLLTAEQAADLLACKPRSVSRYVAPVRRRTWKESDVQRYIAGLNAED